MSGNIDTSAETIERVRKELAGATIMHLANPSSVAKTRLKQAVTDAHSHGELSEADTAAMFARYDLAGA